MIIDHIRDLDEFVRFYKEYRMPKRYKLKWLIKNPNLFCVYHEKEGNLLGFITVQRESGYLTLSGASVRKNMLENMKNRRTVRKYAVQDISESLLSELLENIRFINMVCEAFNEDMYAFTKVKPAIVVLKKAGFKHVKKDMYVKEKSKPIEQLFNWQFNTP